MDTAQNPGGPAGGTRWSTWLSRVTLASTPASCLGVLLWGVTAVLWVAVMVALPVAVMYLVCRSNAPRAADPVGRPLFRSACTVALGATVGIVSLAALAAISAALAFLFLVGVCATTPPVTDFLRRRRRGPVTGTVTGPTPGPDGVQRETVDLPTPMLTALLAEPATEMSDARLCWAWRHSFVALQNAHTAAGKARVVTLRQTYLDEIESRNAGALEAWLASGARAAGGPERFLAQDGRGRPEVA